MKRLSPKVAGMVMAAVILMVGCESSVFQAVQVDVELARQGGLASIIVKRGTTGIPSGGTFDFGGVIPTSPVTIAFTIENRGSGTLNLTGASEVEISGDAAFEIVTQPSSTIAGGSSTVFELMLTTANPAGTTYEAALSIPTNDPETGSYEISVTGMSASNQPPAGSITIGGTGDPSHTSDTTPPIYFQVTDDSDGPGDIEIMVSNNLDFSGAGWQAYTSYISAHLLPADSSDGTKRVYVKFRDSELNESVGISDTIYLDTTGPTGSVSIANGYAYTEIGSPTSVSLAFPANDGSGSGVSHMRVANGSDPTGASWQTYSSSVGGWSLASGYGTRQVSAQFRDTLGNISGVYTDTIKVDDAYEGTSGNNWWDPGEPFELWTTQYNNNGVNDQYGFLNSQAYQGYAAQGDHDWFRIYANDGEWPRVTVSRQSGTGTLTLAIYRVDSNDVVNLIDQVSGTTATVWWVSDHSADFVDDPGYYYIRVTGPNVYAEYDMQWEDCDDCGL